jgi:hypothetical protein
MTRVQTVKHSLVCSLARSMWRGAGCSAARSLGTEAVRTRVAVEEIYAKDLTRTCNHGLDSEELAFLNKPEHGGDQSHVYGDSDAEQVLHLFRLLRGFAVTEGDVFYDLGSGSGRLTMLVHFLTPTACSRGVELSLTRHRQAMVAMDRARDRSLLGRDAGESARGRGRSLEFRCGSMLEDHLEGATMVFCYNLCLDAPFLRRLHLHLLERLPTGAAVLIGGKGLGDSSGGTSSACRRLELRLRTCMFYGYIVVDNVLTSGGTRGVATRRYDLRMGRLPLGDSSFERRVFFEAHPEAGQHQHEQMGASHGALCTRVMANGRTQWVWSQTETQTRVDVEG